MKDPLSCFIWEKIREKKRLYSIIENKANISISGATSLMELWVESISSTFWKNQNKYIDYHIDIYIFQEWGRGVGNDRTRFDFEEVLRIQNISRVYVSFTYSRMVWWMIQYRYSRNKVIISYSCMY